MALKVIVWGTGNVGRPALRAVLSHAQLELAGCVVANPDKVGVDAGVIAGLPPVGVTATDEGRSLLSGNPDCVIYAATADTRPEEAHADLMACLEAGVNVVSTAFYALLHPTTAPENLLKQIRETCARSGASVFISGIDPGWAMDALPIMLSAACSDIREVRAREIFNYALYDQPQVVREVIGFGQPMDQLPIMLHDIAIELVWAPMLRIVGDAMGRPVESVAVEVERRPLEQDVEVPGMGLFEAGTQGAFRFEIAGINQGQRLFVIEHVTRIDDNCAPGWPYPPEGGGCHQVIISGNPDLHVTIHGKDHFEPGPAGGGNATAANWIVNAIPAVVAAQPGAVTVNDIGTPDASAQLLAAG